MTKPCRGTSVIRNSALLGPYSRKTLRALTGGAVSYERVTPVNLELERDSRGHILAWPLRQESLTLVYVVYVIYDSGDTRLWVGATSTSSCLG